MRPRKVALTAEGECSAEKYQQLFEKTSQLVIYPIKFDFNLIPAGKKHVIVECDGIYIDPEDYFGSDGRPSRYIETEAFFEGISNFEANLWKLDDQTVEIRCNLDKTVGLRMSSEFITFDDSCLNRVRFLKIICDKDIHYFRYGKQTNIERHTRCTAWRYRAILD